MPIYRSYQAELTGKFTQKSRNPSIDSLPNLVLNGLINATKPDWEPEVANQIKPYNSLPLPLLALDYGISL